ncbi:hypothetical protein QBC47DRAFT_377055 [Echria macrotheca]|uniref:Oxidoreductase n=1 Tax=Echria macrotheca TaxID=438768 RepID=A0AAJ0BH62_9PEZI|nr:hypothetical protein QBC47DRAFT_377055 [Echria macrotheca]
MAPIKVGFIGYGGSTKSFHLPFVLPNPDLHVYAFLQRAAAPENPSEAKPYSHCTIDFPDAKHYRTADEFFADEAIELVIVCTHQHAEFVEKALVAGKHVVVEKPFVNTTAEADRLIALAKEKGKILTVYQNRRFDSDFRTLSFLHKQGALGTVLEADIHFDFPTPSWISGWTSPDYTPGQGMVFALGTHTIDQALHLFGPPTSVTAFFRSNRGVESKTDDTHTIILQYSPSSNLIVTIKTSIVSHMKDQLRMFVRGTKGTYLKFGSDPQEARALASPCHPASDPGYGLEPQEIWGTLTTTDEFDPDHQVLDEASGLYVGKFPSLPGWYRGYYENVVRAIRGEEEVYVRPEESRDGLRVIELARQSFDEGRTVAWS